MHRREVPFCRVRNINRSSKNNRKPLKITLLGLYNCNEPETLLQSVCGFWYKVRATLLKMWQNTVTSALAWDMEEMLWTKQRNMMIKKILPGVYQLSLEDFQINMRIIFYLKTSIWCVVWVNSPLISLSFFFLIKSKVWKRQKKAAKGNQEDSINNWNQIFMPRVCFIHRD